MTGIEVGVNVEASANISRYHLQLMQNDRVHFHILQLSGYDYGLNAHYYYQLEVVSEQYYPPENLLGQSACLVLQNTQQPYYIHGLLDAVSYIDSYEEHYYRFSLYSPLQQLKYNQTNRVLVNKNVVAIVKQVLQENNWQTIHYRIMVQREFPNLPWLIQYNESDYELLNRLIAEYGLVYRFEQLQQHARLLIYDDPKLQPTIKVTYAPGSGHSKTECTIFQWQHFQFHLPDHVSLRLTQVDIATNQKKFVTHNRTEIIGGKEIDIHRYCDEQRMTFGNYFSNLLQEQLDWQRELFVASSDIIGLTPGMELQLVDAKPNNTERYLIISIDSQGQQLGASDQGQERTSFRIRPQNAAWQCRLLLCRAQTPYRKPSEHTVLSKTQYQRLLDHTQLSLTSLQAIPRTRFNGLLPALIEGREASHVCFDDKGRYRVRLLFDKQACPIGQASPAISRIHFSGAVDSAGPGVSYLPLYAGELVLLKFIDGDFSLPLILGMLPNRKQPSPVTSHNHYQHIIRSYRGHTVLIEDSQQGGRIQLHTANEKNYLRLLAYQKDHHISLTSLTHSITLSAEKHLYLSSASDYQQKSIRNYRYIKDNYWIVLKQGTIQQTAAHGIRQIADRDIRYHSEQGSFQFSHKRLRLSAAGQFSLSAANLSFRIKRGKCRLHGGQEVMLRGQKHVVLRAGMSGIELSGEGALRCYSPHIILQAPLICVAATIDYNQ